ncbi:hypothetical protein [Granulicella arctica]|uniref:hypothetical protein n=1 Tax=Granulicella arctica TaxID=940613 RepID=UPI0021DF7D78|nr:hypothetical protein [Granulicella arctica]
MSRTPTVVNQNPFADPAFRQHFREAHAQNVARHIPKPPTLAPEPERGRKTWDTRRNYRPELDREHPLSR